VIGKPYSVICAGAGSQTVRAGKGRNRTDTGAGNDRIYIGKSSGSIARGGLGNDVIIGSKGPDYIYASPRRVPRGAADRDTVRGMGGNDRIYDYGGTGNLLYGLGGVDRIHSLGRAISSSFGGNGSDFLYSDGGRTASGKEEKLFGERGNDRLNANQPRSDGPAFLDGGSGDDWVNGTSFGDTVIINAGIVKVDTGAGNDLIVSTSAGNATVNGGAGSDTISYATHTPSQRSFTGVSVDLRTGVAKGNGKQQLSGIENVTGSSFEDTITGRPGVMNRIVGGLGDDILTGQYGDGDIGNGGLGLNECTGFAETDLCGENSPGNTGRGRVVFDTDASGVLIVKGRPAADHIVIAYNSRTNDYRVTLDSSPMVSGLCSQPKTSSNTVLCRANRNNLNGILLYGDDGGDRLTIAGSVPAFVTTMIDGGSGRNVLTGGRTRDVISTEGNSTGSVINGGGNPDQLYLAPGGTVNGGTGSDVIHSMAPCDGGRVTGGRGTDNLVFAGAPRGVRAKLAGYAGYVSGPCSRQTKIGADIESLEGTAQNDVLTLGRKLRSQGRTRSLLGRGGFDVLNTRNGSKDSVMTGDGGRRNKVIADRIDRVIWGWGLAAY
jgi:Ca2+-binding RTX toxin-like protein